MKSRCEKENVVLIPRGKDNLNKKILEKYKEYSKNQESYIFLGFDFINEFLIYRYVSHIKITKKEYRRLCKENLNFDTYEKWEKHITSIIRKIPIRYYDELHHYLICKKRNVKLYFDTSNDLSTVVAGGIILYLITKFFGILETTSHNDILLILVFSFVSYSGLIVHKISDIYKFKNRVNEMRTFMYNDIIDILINERHRESNYFENKDYNI